MDTRFDCEIAKVVPDVTAGKEEAPRRIVKLTLAREFDVGFAEDIKAVQTRALLLSGDLTKASVPIDALTLKATFRGIARGEKQGTVSMILHGVVAKLTAGREDGAPSAVLVFNLDYQSALAVFLIENLKSVVEVHLQTLQEDLPGTDKPVKLKGLAAVAEEAEMAAEDDPTAPEGPPAQKGKGGRKKKNGALDVMTGGAPEAVE